jgi:cytochrome o ubiquinol oxidase subunit 3
MTHETHEAEKANLGFWLYLLTDFIVFATLLATYLVLEGGTNGKAGPLLVIPKQLGFNLMLLFLVSSLTAGLSKVFFQIRKQKWVFTCLIITGILGIIGGVDLTKHLSELTARGLSWNDSAFLSMYYSVLGTFILHLAIGFTWIVAYMFVLVRDGLTPNSYKRINLMKMFWQYLYLVWIFIYALVFIVRSV